MTTPADTTSASIHGNDALLSNDKTHHYHGGKMQHRLAPRRPSNNTRSYNNIQKHRQGNNKKKSNLSYAGSYRGGLWNQVYGHSAAPPVAGYYNPTSTRGQQPFSFPQAGLPDGGIYYPSSTTTTMAYRYHKGTTYYNLRRDNNGKSSNKSPPAAAVAVGPDKSSLSVDAKPFVPGKFVASTTTPQQGRDAVGGVPHGGAKNIKILLPTLNDDDDGHHHKTNKTKNQEDATNSTTPIKNNKPVLVLDAATPTTAKSQNIKIENKNDGAAKDKKKSVVVKMGPPPGFASPLNNKAAPVAVVSPSPGLVRRRDDASVDSRGGVMVVGAVSPSPLKDASPRSSSATNTMNNKAAPAIVSPLPTPARVLPPPPGLSKTEEKVSSTAFLPKELWAETVDDLSPKEKEAMIAPTPVKTHSPSPVTVADYPALVVVDSKQTSVQSPWNTNTNKTKKNAWNRGSAAVLAAVSPQHRRNSSSTPPVQTAWANKAVVVPEEAPTPTTSNSSSSKTVVGMEEHHQPAKQELADEPATDYDDEEEEEDSPFTRGLSPKDLLLQAHGVHFVKTPRQW